MVRALVCSVLLLGCASSAPQRSALDQTQYGGIDVVVVNNVFDRVTIYVAEDNVIVRRVGACSGVSRCILSIPPSSARRIYVIGVIELGWRFTAQARDAGRVRSVRAAAWEGMSVGLQIDAIRTWIFPLTGDRRAD